MDAKAIAQLLAKAAPVQPRPPPMSLLKAKRPPMAPSSSQLPARSAVSGGPRAEREAALNVDHFVRAISEANRDPVL